VSGSKQCASCSTLALTCARGTTVQQDGDTASGGGVDDIEGMHHHLINDPSGLLGTGDAGKHMKTINTNMPSVTIMCYKSQRYQLR
jgi:hypothetical protein